VINAQVNLKPLLGGTELQPHVCDLLEDSRRHIGSTEEIKNNVLPPHHSSGPTGLVNGSDGGNLRPPADHLSHQQNVGRPLKTSLHYSQSVMHQSSGDQRNCGAVVKFPQLKHRQSLFGRDDWRTRRDSHSPQVYDAVRPDIVHRQNYHDAVSNSFHLHFIFFAHGVNCNTAK